MMTRKTLTTFLILAALRSATFADTVFLAPQKDNTLYEDGKGLLSNGHGAYMFAGKTNAPSLRRGLIAFDLTSIPTNATITGVTLSMFLSMTHGGSATVSLSKALQAWGEGASDAGEPGGAGIQAQPNDATWFHTFYNTSLWVNHGGDFSATVSASTTVNAVNTIYTWSGSGMLADVQAWVSNPAINFGWVIRGTETTGKAQRFNTRENLLNNPPLLTVIYQAPPPTPTATPTASPITTPTATPTPSPIATPTPTTTPTASPIATPTPTSSPIATLTPTATPTPSPIATLAPTATPTSSPIATPTPTATATPTAAPTPTATPGTLGNISTRSRVETGDNVLIGGFIVTGTQQKMVIVRAIGPSLPVAGALADPILELRDSSGGLILSNDNWRTGGQEAEIIATTIPPSNDLESAIVATLAANSSAYTAIVRGVNNGTGIGLVEAYDLDQTVDSKLANISTRGLVQTGDDVLIGGLIVRGQNPLRVIVRAIGPSLPVSGALGDPTLELRDSNGVLVQANDNWRSAQESEIIATGIPPTNDLESAIVRDFTPGSYTAIVRGVNNMTGLALVEAYDLN